MEVLLVGSDSVLEGGCHQCWKGVVSPIKAQVTNWEEQLDQVLVLRWGLWPEVPSISLDENASYIVSWVRGILPS